MTMAPEKVEELVQATLPAQAATRPAVTQAWPPEPDVELANILNCQRRINMPSPNEKGVRVVGWAIAETDVGLGTTLLVLERIANLAQHARVTADQPSTLGAGGSLEDDLTSSSEISRLKQALEEIANLPVGGNPVGFYTAAQNMKATAREALTSTPLEKTDGK